MNNLTEKHRPKSFDEIVGNREHIEKLQNFVTRPKGAVPNMLFLGPPGCGKTTAARCFATARKLWTEQNSKDPFACLFDANYSEYNASQYRGIDTIREIARYAGLSCETITYLDESDNFTKDAQEALRSPLENKGNAIFILAGNDEAGFSDAIKSRCVIFRFQKLETPEIYNRLLYILKAEDVKVTEQIEKKLKELAKNADGDLRKAINALEALIR